MNPHQHHYPFPPPPPTSPRGPRPLPLPPPHMYAKRRNLFLQAFDEQGQAKPDEGTRPTLLSDVKNDYSQHFLETRARPQNFIRDVTVEDGFAEYPKLARLLAAKQEMVESRKTPPMHVQADLKTFDLRSLGTKFDLIYIDPPWEEYVRRAAPFRVGTKTTAATTTQTTTADSSGQVWRYEDLVALPLEEIADVPSFIFLWCGSGGRVTENAEHGALHVEDGRRLLKKWGYRRCEELCWVKTNKQGQQQQPDQPTSTTSLLVRTKEHCLMGIKGSVRRNRDGHLIHCNVHTDLVVAEQPTDPLSTAKPEEMYTIMEQFCLGRRRLELFGSPRNIRPGWVTVGKDLPGTTYDAAQYLAWMAVPGMNPDGTPCAGHLVGSTPLIEELRPKTPPREQREREGQMLEGGPPASMPYPRPRSGSIPPMRPRFPPQVQAQEPYPWPQAAEPHHYHHQQQQQQQELQYAADYHYEYQQQQGMYSPPFHQQVYSSVSTTASWDAAAPQYPPYYAAPPSPRGGRGRGGRGRGGRGGGGRMAYY